MTLDEHQIEFWTALFQDEFDAEQGGDVAAIREVHRRVLREHAKDQDRDLRAAVGRLRQEVRVQFFTNNGYVERPDSRGTMRFVDPNRPDDSRRELRRPKRRIRVSHRVRWVLIAVVGGVGVLIFGTMLVC